MNQSNDMTCAESRILAVASVPMQEADFDALYPLNEALEKGTVFPELYMPFLAVGGAK